MSPSRLRGPGQHRSSPPAPGRSPVAGCFALLLSWPQDPCIFCNTFNPRFFWLGFFLVVVGFLLVVFVLIFFFPPGQC